MYSPSHRLPLPSFCITARLATGSTTSAEPKTIYSYPRKKEKKTEASFKTLTVLWVVFMCVWALSSTVGITGATWHQLFISQQWLLADGEKWSEGAVSGTERLNLSFCSCSLGLLTLLKVYRSGCWRPCGEDVGNLCFHLLECERCFKTCWSFKLKEGRLITRQSEWVLVAFTTLDHLELQETIESWYDWTCWPLWWKSEWKESQLFIYLPTSSNFFICQGSCNFSRMWRVCQIFYSLFQPVHES